jgi:hypothetical protein
MLGRLLILPAFIAGLAACGGTAVLSGGTSSSARAIVVSSTQVPTSSASATPAGSATALLPVFTADNSTPTATPKPTLTPYAPPASPQTQSAAQAQQAQAAQNGSIVATEQALRVPELATATPPPS